MRVPLSTRSSFCRVTVGGGGALQGSPGRVVQQRLPQTTSLDLLDQPPWTGLQGVNESKSPLPHLPDLEKEIPNPEGVWAEGGVLGAGKEGIFAQGTGFGSG